MDTAKLPIVPVASLFHACGICRQKHSPGLCQTDVLKKINTLVLKVQQEDVAAKEAAGLVRLQQYVESNGCTLEAGWRVRIKPRVTKRPDGRICRSTHNDYFDPSGKRHATFSKVLEALKAKQKGCTTDSTAELQQCLLGPSTPDWSNPTTTDCSDAAPCAPSVKRQRPCNPLAASDASSRP